MKPQNILVTGGAGDALLRQGELLLACLHERHPNLEFIQGDVRDADSLWH